jgi:phosphoadenosine phosphosulfate reductase
MSPYQSCAPNSLFRRTSICPASTVLSVKAKADPLRIESISLELGVVSAAEAIRWAWETFGDRCCVLSSMQDAVLIDLVMQVAPKIPIVFLDTGWHFDATFETLRRIENRYDIEVEILRSNELVWDGVSPGGCCDSKVGLLEQALDGREAWLSGIQRTETETREHTPIVGFDRRGIVKVSPLAQWNDQDRSLYIADSDVITHPLLAQGYASIGCEPCTTRASDGGRSGRWVGTERTECGLHL